MIAFLSGILILVLGYVFYSRYAESNFIVRDEKTPATSMTDGVDFVPIKKGRNCFIHLLNIAGMGPILGAVQGILFGKIAFILIPLGAVFMGGVHDYFAGMISVRNQGSQITGIIEKYLGKNEFKLFIVIVSIMLLLLASVFVYTSGDIFVERFFNVSDFSLNNPIVVTTYIAIVVYFIIATLFPVDKIIGRFYPVLTLLLILGTGMILAGFFINGINLDNNIKINNLPVIPMFFMTVSCGLLSGFHATQATIVSRTIENEKDGRLIFYGMMIVESLIAMIWAAGAMDVYSYNLVPQNIIGTANTVNIIADKFVPFNLAFLVTIAVIILPITSGDTALRGLRMIIAQSLNMEQKNILNRLKIAIPIVLLVVGILFWAKTHPDSFTLIWRYFTFFNQLIAVPVLACASVYLYKIKKNYYMTLIPCIFYVFITSSFILNNKIGFNLPLSTSEIIGSVFGLLFLIYIIKKFKKAIL